MHDRHHQYLRQSLTWKGQMIRGLVEKDAIQVVLRPYFKYICAQIRMRNDMLQCHRRVCLVQQRAKLFLKLHKIRQKLLTNLLIKQFVRYKKESVENEVETILLDTFNWRLAEHVLQHYLKRCQIKSSNEFLKYWASKSKELDGWTKLKIIFTKYKNQFLSKLYRLKEESQQQKFRLKKHLTTRKASMTTEICTT